MNQKNFWELIETAKKQSGGDLGLLYGKLVNLLAARPVADIMAWQGIFSEYQSLSYKEKLWAAAYAINGGCSDDGFDYFRGWLTAHGKAVFLAALADPDSLAGYDGTEEDAEFEDMLSVACYAYFKKLNITNHDYDLFYKELEKHPLPDTVKAKMREEIRYADGIDEKWDEDELEFVVPGLCERFEWENGDYFDDDDDDEAGDGAFEYKDVSGMTLPEKLAYWHESEQHAAIIIEIENLPEDEITYELKGLLARAYNNVNREAIAMEILETVRLQGEDDPLWFFRYGYALYYSDRIGEALDYFRRCKELNPRATDVDEFIEMCEDDLE
jgi:tetratricopeptide (TPR) repeat protein